MFEVVLFELEGVLAETLTLRREALVRSLAEDGVVISPTEYDAVCAGFPVRQGALTAVAVRSLNRDETAIDLMTHRAERYFAENVGQGLSFVRGARELLEDAGGRARLGIVTRASRNEVDLLLSMASLDKTFEVIISADDVGSAKPSPEAYERALERFARRQPVRPAATIALEDGPLGIMAAHAVRLRCVLVGTIPTYHAVTADASIPSLENQTLASLSELVERGDTWSP